MLSTRWCIQSSVLFGKLNEEIEPSIMSSMKFHFRIKELSPLNAAMHLQSIYAPDRAAYP